MASILTIAGQTVDLDATRTVLNRLTLSVDETDSLEWGQWGVTLPLPWHVGQDVSLTVDGTLVFAGEIASTHIPGVGDGPIDAGYRAMGLKWACGSIPVTNPMTGTGSIQFNLPSTDPNYITQLSGQSVGEILAYLLTHHATALATCGATGYNASDLTPLTIVPPTTSGVLIQGSSFIDQCEMFLKTWYAQYVLYIPADGIIRVVDSTAFTPTTFTLDSDPITVGELSRDSSRCYTRVVIRGWAEVEPAYLSLSEGTLKEAFTTADKLQWNWYAYTQPGNAIDQGTITALTSTQITVQSDNPKETWGVNYWPNIEAFVQLIDPIASDLSFTENRHITANTALTAGGTSVITMDLALINSGYTRYYIWGQPPAVSNTWRLYDIVPNWVAQHLVKQFPYSVPWSPSSSELVMVNYPIASVCWSPNGQQPYTEVPYPFELLPESGQIRFTQPTVRIFGTLANLEKGGNATDGIPDDIKVLVPYSRGTLTAVCPADAYGGVPQYSGTAYTQDGIEWTLYQDFPQWMWAGDESNYQQLACQILATISNTLVTGSLTWWGKNTSLLTLGLAANIARVGGTTGYESINAAIRTVVLEWPQSGPTPWITHASFSTVRRPFSGDALYVHPMFREGRAFGADGFQGMNMADPAWVASTLAQSMGLTGEAHNPYLDTIGRVLGNKDLAETGREAGKESLAGMLGNTNAVRRSLGLKTDDDKRNDGQVGENGMGNDFGGGFGGGFGDGFGGADDWGDDQPRPNRRRRKRPTLRPRARPQPVTGPESELERMSSVPAALGGPSEPLRQRDPSRKGDPRDRPALRDRHSDEDDTP